MHAQRIARTIAISAAHLPGAATRAPIFSSGVEMDPWSDEFREKLSALFSPDRPKRPARPPRECSLSCCFSGIFSGNW